jgi:hypothetical protein
LHFEPVSCRYLTISREQTKSHFRFPRPHDYRSYPASNLFIYPNTLHFSSLRNCAGRPGRPGKVTRSETHRKSGISPIKNTQTDLDIISRALLQGADSSPAQIATCPL